MNYTLRDIFKGKVVFVGIGNPLRSDDGLGLALVDELKRSTEFVCLNAGSAPENYIGKIIAEKPDSVVLIDAVYLGLEPGEYAVLDSAGILNSGLTTHDLSPKMFLEYLASRTDAKVFLLGVQPATVSLGDEMSRPVQKTVQELLRLIKEIADA